ncbi:MAG: hypothetical protein V1818_02465 [Candidatus Aenigmatarchaeota archaeon]
MKDDYYYSKDATETPKEKKKPSRAWYLVPLFFGLIGGLVGYLVVKEDNRKMARNLLIIGIVITILPSLVIVPMVLMYYGFYSPSSFLGPTAQTAVGFEEVQVLNPWVIDASNGQITMNLENRIDQILEIKNIEYTVDATSVSCNPAWTIEPGKSFMVGCTPASGWTPKTVGDAYSAAVVISYAIPPESSNIFTTAGTITGSYS